MNNWLCVEPTTKQKPMSYFEVYSTYRYLVIKIV